MRKTNRHIVLTLCVYYNKWANVY